MQSSYRRFPTIGYSSPGPDLTFNDFAVTQVVTTGKLVVLFVDKVEVGGASSVAVLSALRELSMIFRQPPAITRFPMTIIATIANTANKQDLQPGYLLITVTFVFPVVLLYAPKSF